MSWRWARDLAIGSAAGYAATRIMDKGSAFLYERQDEASREREEELRQEMPTTVLVRRIADWRRLKLDEERVGQLGMWITTDSVRQADRLPRRSGVSPGSLPFPPASPSAPRCGCSSTRGRTTCSD